MIFHTIRSITIGEFAEMMNFEDKTIINRLGIWIPKKIIEKRYSSLILEWNKLSNKDKIDDLIDENKHKLKMLIQVNIHYRIMSELLYIVAMYNIPEARKLLIDVYKYIYHKEPKTQKDYEKILKDLDLKIKKFKQMYGNGENKEEVKEKFDFEKLIINIENILSPLSIRDKKLYVLPKYIELATQKIKQNGGNK